MKTKSVKQYCVQVQNKRTKWGWEFYFKTKKEAQARIAQFKDDQQFEVRAWVETIQMAQLGRSN